MHKNQVIDFNNKPELLKSNRGVGGYIPPKHPLCIRRCLNSVILLYIYKEKKEKKETKKENT